FEVGEEQRDDSSRKVTEHGGIILPTRRPPARQPRRMSAPGRLPKPARALFRRGVIESPSASPGLDERCTHASPERSPRSERLPWRAPWLLLPDVPRLRAPRPGCSSTPRGGFVGRAPEPGHRPRGASRPPRGSAIVITEEERGRRW